MMLEKEKEKERLSRPYPIIKSWEHRIHRLQLYVGQPMCCCADRQITKDLQPMEIILVGNLWW